MPFPCTKCGLCCTKLGGILLQKGSKYQEEIDRFPYKALENGSCEKLKDGLCTVYDDRPNMCNVDYMEKKYQEDNFKEKTIKVCNALIINAGLNKKYLIQ